MVLDIIQQHNLVAQPYLIASGLMMLTTLVVGVFYCLLRLIQDERATSMSLVPTMAAALLNCSELGRFDTSSVKEIHLGGAAS